VRDPYDAAMAYLDVNGHPTWVTVGDTAGETVLLMHGGFTDSDSMLGTIGRPLGDRYRIAAFDRRGHGRTADTDAPFHYDAMADEAIGVIEHLGGPLHIAGFSDGGIVGLLVALRRPDLVDRLVLIGTNFHHDGLHDMPDEGDDDPTFQLLAAAYAERSPNGGEHFATFKDKTIAMFMAEPTLTAGELAGVDVPTLVLAGDDDLIKLDHTCDLYRALPNAQLAIVPAASHLLPVEQPEETARIVERFLTADLPPATMMPIRRA